MNDVDDGRQCVLRCSTVVATVDKVLLVHRRRDGVDDWVLPGGTPKRAESLLSCARREVAEETGLRVTPNRVAFVVESIDPLTGHGTVDVVFLADGHHFTAPTALEPGLTPAFVPLVDLSGLTIRPPIAGHLRSLLTSPIDRTAAYLGNLWRPRARAAARRQP
jgi:8-oxo-dGTP pyrophosphatase MutT (NUDIX family)